jgi:surface protein
MFEYCTSLISLPDISRWNTSLVTDMNHLFAHCSSLKSLPDLFEWKTSKVKN